MAYDDEILIEKSPEYLGSGTLTQVQNRAKVMKRALGSKVKFLVFLCDPLKRMLSWIKQREAAEDGWKKKGKKTLYDHLNIKGKNRNK